MKIDKADLRVVKGQGSTEVFLTSEKPLINTVLRLPPDIDLESGEYSVTFTKTPAKATEAPKAAGK